MANFDGGAESSPLYAYIAKEFNARGTALRKLLGTKEHGASLAARLGLTSAQKLLVTDSPDVFEHGKLPDRFVLKYAHGWSSRGVMLLEGEADSNQFFEHLSQRLLGKGDLIERQRRVANSFPGKPDEWIVEEWLNPASPGSVPFDYKFYTFRESVALIVQIDRNVQPVKVALFDGEFRPLRPGTDYVMTGSAQYGQHLMPKHPLQMLRWAATLSRETDAPFVSIDLFDTPRGPAFGEFTFSPGAMHKRMWTLSEEVITMLDAHFAAGAAPEGRWSWISHECGSAIASASLMTLEGGQLSSAEEMPYPLYRNWSRYLYNGGRRGAARASEYYRERANAAADPRTGEIASGLASRWASIRAYPLAVE